MYLQKVSLTAPWWENWRRQTLGTEKTILSSRFHDNRRVWTKNPGIILYSFLPLRLHSQAKALLGAIFEIYSTPKYSVPCCFQAGSAYCLLHLDDGIAS